MELSRVEEDMLAGRHGPAKKLAMEGLVQLGRAYGAPRMVEIGYAHVHAGMALYLEDVEVEDKTVNLSPGMAVTVEIKTGSRSLLSYLLSPLVRYKHDSLRER